MAKIALIWELGADLGHVTRYSIIARELLTRGHEPVLILRDVTRIREVFDDDSIAYYQAPLCQYKPQGLPPSLNLVETLFLVGFLEPQKLLSLVKSWRYTFDFVKPEILVLDHAPVAQLASHGLHYKKIIVTNSFSVPPLATPFPPYRYWQPEVGISARMKETEERCTRHANYVLENLQQSPLETMADLFRIEQIIFCERREFDVYGPREGVTYVGSINDNSLGSLPTWPNHSGPKIFAYLKVIFPHIEALLSILSSLDAQVIAYVPGLSNEMRQKYQSNAFIISERPLQLRAVAEECDYALCHGGTGTMNTFVESGVPVFALPLFVEQMMLSIRVAEAGLGEVFPLQADVNSLAPMLLDFLDDKHLPSKVTTWAAKAESSSMTQRSALVCDTIEALL